MGRPASSFDSFREGPSTGLNYPSAVHLGDGSTQLQKPESEDSTLGFALIKFPWLLCASVSLDSVKMEREYLGWRGEYPPCTRR